jgi:hypothetical protein
LAKPTFAPSKVSQKGKPVLGDAFLAFCSLLLFMLDVENMLPLYGLCVSEVNSTQTTFSVRSAADEG